MKCLFSLLKKKSQRDIEEIAKQQLAKNVRVIESLRDYDAGKKDISISNVERCLQGIRVTH